MLDLFSELRHAYDDARRVGDAHAMEVATHALSLAASGNRDLALELAAQNGLLKEETLLH